MPVSALALRNCRLFAQAPDAVVEQASAHMEIIHLKRREVLRINDRPFRGLGVVLQGRLQAIDHTIDGREVALTTIEPDGVFGVAHLIAPHPVEMTWMAVSPTSLAIMAPTAAFELLKNADMSLRVATDLAQQVCEFLGWQKILSVHPVSARLCAWLIWNAAGSRELTIPTHAELAWRLNTTRESITRILQRLQADDVLRRDGDRWLVESPSALEVLARGEAGASP
jgi:CRP-like cAMP-binding protein